MPQDDYLFLTIVNFQLHQGLGQFFINQSDVANQIASHGILRIFRTAEFNNLGQVMEHNPCEQQTFIKLRINVSDSICQLDHSSSMKGQTRLKSMVIGLSSWIRIKLLVILAIKRADHALPDRILNLENHLR